MEQNTSQFSELINMIKASTMEENFKGIAIRNFHNQFVNGEIMHGLIIKPFQLKVTDKDNLCQNLYDILTSEFGEQLRPGYSHSFDGGYEYFMTLGDNVTIYFPNGQEYNKWIYNQIQKDNENNREKNKRR